MSMMVSSEGGAAAPVLVVEDDATTAEIFGLSLRAAGYQVRLVGDAESALTFVEHDVPSVMIIDLRLPTIDGLELLRCVRARAGLRAVPVAVVTGDYFVEDAIVAAFQELGAQVFFKPVWDEDLTRIVGDLIAGRQTH